MVNRKDGLFTRLPSSKINAIRQDKLNGYSLNEISLRHGVSKATASLYCRDLFYYPGRVYQTEAEYREAILLRKIGTDHNKYKLCKCGAIIRNKPERCSKCLIEHNKTTGEIARFVESGIPCRFHIGDGKKCEPHKRGYSSDGRAGGS